MLTSHNLTLSFLVKQIEDIKKGGPTIIISKIKLLVLFLLELVLLIPFIPIVIIIRIISSFKLIRFKQLRSDRIGHFAYEPDIYLLEREIGLHDKNTIDIFYYQRNISNQQLKKMWDRRLPFVSKLALPLDHINKLLPGGYRHTVPLCETKHEDPLSLQDRYGTMLSFTSEEEKLGKEGLRSMGINPGDEFICFHSRDSKYLYSEFNNLDYSYHDFRDSSIQNYVLAAESIVNKGYFAIRMGAITGKELVTKEDKIIDYVNEYRTEFMDIYLLANCIFFLGTCSGPSALATIFRRPFACANATPFLGMSLYRNTDIYIPKNYWLISENRLMTFNEIISSGAASFFSTNLFIDAGIKLIDNTPDEISELAIEMDNRIKGTWQLDKNDDKIHKKYNSILEKNPLTWEIYDPKVKRRPKIATSFLRKHTDLLD